MQDNVYDEILEEIKNCMQKQDFEKALRLVLNELEMPYIPCEFETHLLQMKTELEQRTKDHPSGRLSEEAILDGLNGTLLEQLQAVEALHHCRCEEFSQEIQAYFNRHPHPNLQALLIETLIDQRIMTDFTIEHEGMQITFIPRYVEKPQDTDGFVEAEACLAHWFESEDPSFLALCRQLLAQETFLMLPLAYEAEEGKMLALSIAEEVSRSLDAGKTFEQLKKALNLTDLTLLPLRRNNN